MSVFQNHSLWLGESTPLIKVVTNQSAAVLEKDRLAITWPKGWSASGEQGKRVLQSLFGIEIFCPGWTHAWLKKKKNHCAGKGTEFPNIMKFFSSGPSWVWENQKCRRSCCEILSLSLPLWSVFLPVPGWVWEATVWMLHWTLWVCRKAVKIANGGLRTQTIEVKGHWD